MMKIEYGTQVCAFGGYYFLIELFDKLGIDQLLIDELPKLPAQSIYNWREIIYSLWSIPFCGGSSLEDINQNLRFQFANNPILEIPNADRIGARLRELSEGVKIVKSRRGETAHEFSWSHLLNQLLIKSIFSCGFDAKAEHVLDYDNTILPCEKSDAKKSYKKGQDGRSIKGYQPGVATIKDLVVFVEQRNGNSVAGAAQAQTLKRLFELMDQFEINITKFRADSASYQWEIMHLLHERNIDYYLRAIKNQSVIKEIAKITNWKPVKIEGKKNAFRGSIKYSPSQSTCSEIGIASNFETRLVVTKWDKSNGQLNVFTQEACHYSVIATNDENENCSEVVEFYNNRGESELHFKELKNDFGWNNLPFSKLDQNYVYLVFMAICKNLYKYAIADFSKVHPFLRPNYHLKKFRFRFIAIPVKWIKSGRQYILRIFSQLRLYNSLLRSS